MKNIEQRVMKLEDAVERRLDISGRLAARQAQREMLIELSKIPEAVELAREVAEMIVTGKPDQEPLRVAQIEERLDELLGAQSESSEN